MIDTLKCGNEDSDQRLRQTVLALAERCPMGPKNPEMCPLYSVRKGRPAVRADWVESLQPMDLEFVTSYHQVCSKWQKEGRP